MNREIYIDVSFGMMRAAVVEDGRLCEFHSERMGGKKLTESVFLGRVSQIRPSVGAAFVDIGEPLNAFLPIEDGHALHCGDLIVVQGAAKQANETKGLRVSAKLNLAGQWLVLIPGETGVHISKKVKDPELRAQLSDVGQEICPEGCGLIVRTASGDVTKEAMADEAQILYHRWKDIELKARGKTTPCVLYERTSLDERLIRDLAGNDLTSIVTNDEACFVRLKKAQTDGRIAETVKINRYEEREQLLFDVFSIESQIEKALHKRVWLPCGGYLIIDHCEAMTVIDVNSGKMMLGREIEETALRVNLEAAAEIARQIRLREIGGIIVVDFIDMMKSENRDLLIAQMREAVKADRSQVKIEGITRLGLMEITRKRKHTSLRQTMRSSCGYCGGAGELAAPEQVAQNALRQVKRMTLSGQRGLCIIRCAPPTAAALLERRTPADMPIYVIASAGRHYERFDIEQAMGPDAIPGGAKPLEKE